MLVESRGIGSLYKLITWLKSVAKHQRHNRVIRFKQQNGKLAKSLEN